MQGSTDLNITNVTCTFPDVQDVVFLLDASGSVRDNNPIDHSYDNWNLMLSFVVDLTKSLDVRRGGTQIGERRIFYMHQSVKVY